jgi:hypothetical protein
VFKVTNALAGNYSVYIVNVPTKKTVAIPLDIPFSEIKLSPDRKTIAAYGIDHVAFLNIDPGVQDSLEVDYTSLSAVAFSWGPNSDYFVTSPSGNGVNELLIGERSSSEVLAHIPLPEGIGVIRDIDWSQGIVRLP